MPLPGIGFAGGSAWYLKLFNLAGVCLKQALMYKKHIDRYCIQNIMEDHLDIWRKFFFGGVLYVDSASIAIYWR